MICVYNNIIIYSVVSCARTFIILSRQLTPSRGGETDMPAADRRVGVAFGFPLGLHGPGSCTRFFPN